MITFSSEIYFSCIAFTNWIDSTFPFSLLFLCKVERTFYENDFLEIDYMIFNFFSKVFVLNNPAFERDLMCALHKKDGWNEKFNSFLLFLSLYYLPWCFISYIEVFYGCKVYRYINIWNGIVCKCLHL